jgi:putative acetyltransferase
VALTIAVEDPTAPDVQALLRRHLQFAHDESPPEHVHAYPAARLAQPSVTFFSARRDGALVGVGALSELDPAHGEVKSMHTAAEARGQGVARAMLTHLVAVARERGYRRVSLETGATEAFQPARTLYESFGFVRCPPFAQYTDNEFSVCMTRVLDGLPVTRG